MTKALVIVDIQNDFVEGGSLAVAGGTAMAEELALAISEGDFNNHILVTTQDWHINPGSHFSNDPDYVDSWPVHCQANTPGANIVDSLETALAATGRTVTRVTKGEQEAAYSGFEGRTADGKTLAEALREQGVTELDVVGIATDYCVRATALDGAAEGFTVRVLLNYCVGISQERINETVNVDFKSAGVKAV